MTISETENASGTTLVLKKLFKRLSPADIDALRQVATVQQYPAGTVLCRQGAVEKVFYVLRQGTVKITQRLSDTEEILIALRNPGEFFGEMALIDNSPRSATVTAVTAVDRAGNRRGDLYAGAAQQPGTGVDAAAQFADRAAQYHAARRSASCCRRMTNCARRMPNCKRLRRN